MTRLTGMIVAASLIAAPVAAEEEGNGRSLMEQGFELFFEGLRQEMAPTLDELQGLAEAVGPSMQSFLTEMGPALAEIAAQVKDWTAYHPPEVLPNGDIIIRKKRTPEEEEPAIPEAPAGPTDT